MYAVADRLDPDSYLELATRRLRRDGARRRHRGRGVPLPAPRPGRTPVRRPERHGRRAGRGGRAGRRPAHPARHLLPRAAGSTPTGTAARRRPAAVRRRHGRRLGRAVVGAGVAGDRHVRVGAAIHSVRAVPAADLGTVVRTAARGPAARPPLRAAGRERGVPRRTTAAAPTELLAEHGVLGPRTTAVHATHLTDHDVAPARRLGHHLLRLPHHRARPRRRDRAGRTRCSTAGSPLSVGSDQHAVVDPFEEVRGARAARTAAQPAAGSLQPRRSCSPPGPPRATPASAGPTAGPSPPGRSPTSCGPHRHRPDGRRPPRRSSSTRPAHADVDTVVVGGRVVVEHGEHRLGPVAGLLARALDRLETP